MTNELFGITEKQATKKANEFAQKQGYSKVELVNKAFTSPEVSGECFLFYVTDDSNKSKKIENIGLPLCIAVDKLTGETYEVRTMP